MRVGGWRPSCEPWPSCRLPQDVEAVICVRGHLRKGTDDRLSVRPADLERLV
jgi:hypothetical protein